MKKKIVILSALAVLLISSTCYAATTGDNARTQQLALEKTEYDTATVTVGILNVREGPSTSFSSICKLERGQTVTIMGKLGDWYAVYNPQTGIVGAVDGRYIKLETTEAVNVTANNDTALRKAPDNEAPALTSLAISEDEQKLLDLVNKARADKGLNVLIVDESLMKTARIKAKDMIDNNYFSHQSPTYGSPFDMMRQFDNTFKSAGENIAGNKTIEGAFKAWMSSETHKKNILNSGFKVTGIGIENSSTYGKILVQQFIGK